ncbi:MAG: D-alanyl-D-alanine carboxypeptidase/D-alanyl-D-alanine-endopeptidase [Candidatus Kapabacteria bacterium]|nr:D-alanyl-D-alanine carboxypeptidase/D-alanyl-D-alanine-endopeptidase [Candidatus Kapabacteria bacterium]
MIILKNFLIFCFLIVFQISSFSQNTQSQNSNTTKNLTQSNDQDVIEKFQKGFSSILSNKGIKNSKFGLAVYSLDKSQYYFRKNSDMLLTPASTTKLFTSFGALIGLGDDFQIRTTVQANAKPENGILNSDIYLVGRGDPVLSTNDIEVLADQIQNSGIKEIRGNVYADISFFDGISDRQIYSGDRDRVQNIPPITVLNIDANTVTVLVTAGSKPGSAVNVQIIPPSDVYTKIINAKVSGARTEAVQPKKSKLKVSSKKIIPIKNKHKKFKKHVSVDYQNEDYLNRYGDSPSKKKRAKRQKIKSTIAISQKADASGKISFIISGSLAPNRSYSSSFQIKRPELVAAGVLKNRLMSGGVKIKGDVAVKKNIDTAKAMTIAEFARPIRDLLFRVNKHSDNYMAEQVFKIVGASSGNKSDNAEGARSLIFSTLQKHEINCEDCELNDGSGLSRRNKVTPEIMVSLLKVFYQSPHFKDFDTTLSIAGIDGTLQRRMQGTSAFRNLHGKTGTLANVSALAGFVSSKDNEKFAFSFIFNGPNIHFYKNLENELASYIAEFTSKLKTNDN